MASEMKWVLIGAGGHAKAIVKSMLGTGQELSAYVDSVECLWLPTTLRYEDDSSVDVDNTSVVMGIGGQTPQELRHRYNLLNNYLKRNATAQPIVHPTAIVSPSAELALGTTVLAGANIQANAQIGPGAIINTGAIVEHDSIIGGGSHVGPGSTVLGSGTIGQCSMIGTRAILLPQSSVGDDTMVRAGSVFGRNSET